MRQSLFIIVILMLVISCKNDTQDSLQNNAIKQTDTLLFGNTPLNYPKLQANTKEILKDWPIFNEFQSDSRLLVSISAPNLKTLSAKLLSQTDSLFKSIPDTLQSQAINSRLRVVNTQLALLKQEINKDKLSVEFVEKNIDETRVAIGNLLLQLNEKFQKDRIDLQRKEDEETELKKELEKQRKARDSIFQLELEDQ